MRIPDGSTGLSLSEEVRCAIAYLSELGEVTWVNEESVDDLVVLVRD